MDNELYLNVKRTLELKVIQITIIYKQTYYVAHKSYITNKFI